MKTSTLLGICLCSVASLSTYAQSPELLKSSRYSFELTRILMKDGTLRTGWFLGTVGDTLVAQIGGRSERIARQDMLRISLEAGAPKSGITLAGVLVGAYATTLFLKAERQPFLFMRSNDDAGPALLAALFGVIGGGIGYLVASTQTGESSFDFTGNEIENEDRWLSLVEGTVAERSKGSLHLSFQGAWVSGPIPRPDGHYLSSYYYAYEAASSLNMARKIQMTYSMTDFLDIGLAAMWLGQPSIGYYTSSPTYYGNTTLSLEGNGFYGVAVLQPFGKSKRGKLQWDVGAGAGAASVDFQAASSYWPSYGSPPPPEQSVQVKEHCFSALVYTELKVFIADFLTLGATADWVYVPHKAPVIQGASLNSTSLGTASVGFVFGFHF